MKTSKNFASILVVSFALIASLFAGGCSSKKATASSDMASDSSAMQPTVVAGANLGKASSGRAR